VKILGTMEILAVVRGMRAVPGLLMPELLDQDRLRLDLGQKPRGEAAQLLLWAVSRVVVWEAARRALGVAQRAAVGDAGGHRRSSEKVRVARPGTDNRERAMSRHWTERQWRMITDDRMTLIELVEKQADSDLVREMLAFAAERIMEAEVEARTGAVHIVR